MDQVLEYLSQEEFKKALVAADQKEAARLDQPATIRREDIEEPFVRSMSMVTHDCATVLDGYARVNQLRKSIAAMEFMAHCGTVRHPQRGLGKVDKEASRKDPLGRLVVKFENEKNPFPYTQEQWGKLTPVREEGEVHSLSLIHI